MSLRRNTTVAFLGLMHLGVTLSACSCGIGGLDDGGIDQRALLHHDASVTKPLVDGVEELAPVGAAQRCRKFMMVVRSGMAWSREYLANRRIRRQSLVECVFHGAVAEVVQLLHAVNAQIRYPVVGTTPVAACIAYSGEVEQPFPGQ